MALNLVVRGGADFSGINKEMTKTQKALSGFQKNVSKAMKSVGITLSALAIGKVIKDCTNMAIQVESAMGQITRQMGANAKEFNNWVENQALGYNMAKSEAYKYGATFSNLVSTFSRDSKEVQERTTELLKTSSIIASGTGRTMEDVMERIRSGMLGSTEAIEDLGINVNIAMLESTNAFKNFANGKSWRQLDFQTQQTIRYFAILEQASAKFGDTVANNTASNLAQFKAQLKNIQLNLGNAFKPILNVVLPLLNALAGALVRVTAVLAHFSQALFGKSSAASLGAKQIQTQTNAINDQAGAINDLNKNLVGTGKAAEKAKGSLAGFDEINKLNLNKDSDSGVSGGGIDTGALTGGIGLLEGLNQTFNEIPANIQVVADKIKGYIAEFADFYSKYKDIIISITAGLVAGILSYFVIGKWATIMNTLTGVIAIIKLIPAALGTVFLSLTSPAVIISAIIGGVVASIVYLWRTSESFRDALTTLVSGVGEILKKLWDDVLKPLGKWVIDILFTLAIKPLAVFLATTFVAAVDIVIKILSSLWKNIISPLATFLIDVFKIALEGIIEIWQAWKPAINTALSLLNSLWESVLKPFCKWLVDIFGASFEILNIMIQPVLNGLITGFKGIIDFIVNIFTGKWSEAWQGVSNAFGNVFEGLKDIAKKPLNGIISLINKVIDGFNKLQAPDWVPLIGGKGINIPKIPMLARGGIIDKPTLAMVGESGKEAVVPLENTSFVDKLASALGSAVMGAMQFNNSSTGQVKGDIVLNIDGTTFARVINSHLTKESNRLGNNLVIATV